MMGTKKLILEASNFIYVLLLLAVLALVLALGYSFLGPSFPLSLSEISTTVDGPGTGTCYLVVVMATLPPPPTRRDDSFLLSPLCGCFLDCFLLYPADGHCSSGTFEQL